MCRFCNTLTFTKANEAAHDDLTQIAIGYATLHSMLTHLLFYPSTLTDEAIDEMRQAFSYTGEVTNGDREWPEGAIKDCEAFLPPHLVEKFFTRTRTKGHL